MLERKWREGNPLVLFSSVTQSCLTLCDPWTAACQASLSITNFRSLFKLTSIEFVLPSNHLILCRPFSFCLLSFPASGSFPRSQFFASVQFSSVSQLCPTLASGSQSIGVSASASVLPMNIQDWSPLGWTDWISMQPKWISRVFSNITVQKHQ